MSDYVDNVGRLKAEFGCTAIIVHHIPKNAETVTERGHGSLRGAIETSLVVSADQETGVRTLRCTNRRTPRMGGTSSSSSRSWSSGRMKMAIWSPLALWLWLMMKWPLAEPAAQISARRSARSIRSFWPRSRRPRSACRATFPDDVLNRGRVGKVVSRKTWRDRWMAIGGS
jgi:hypothetical protein